MSKYTVRLYKNGKGKYTNSQMLAEQTFDTDVDLVEDIGFVAGLMIKEAIEADFKKERTP